MLKMNLEEQCPQHVRNTQSRGPRSPVFYICRGSVIIPKKLQVNGLAMALDSHPDILGILGQFCELVQWPGMTREVKEFVKTCNLGCIAALSRNITLPSEKRMTPERPLQYCSATYKGPIRRKYCFHVFIIHSGWRQTWCYLLPWMECTRY